MKNSLILILLCASLVVGLSSCGSGYQPMSQEEIEAKADSILTADKAAFVEELKARCDSALDAKIEARVKELSNQ